MKKILTTTIILFITVCLSFAEGESPKATLKFNTNGKFKIIQFTDLHYQVDSYRSDSMLVMMKKVVASEKPDLIMLTGDVVCSKNTARAWATFSKTMADMKTPWAAIMGNHDQEYELTKPEIMKAIVGLPYNLTENGPQNITGNGNYVLQVKSSATNKTAAVLYCLDSGTGFHPKGELGSYHWIGLSQINWYVAQSEKFTKANGNNPLPALAFFHIPLPEYKEVLGKGTTIGSQIETVCSPDLNSGLYTAMYEAKDVMGIFVGHDHNNNYIGCLRGIALAYGESTGRQCYGTVGKGARVIELYEGQRKFDTWILKMYEADRDKDIWFPASATERQPQYKVTYPDSFAEPVAAPAK